jgi:hypothetical protein
MPVADCVRQITCSRKNRPDTWDTALDDSDLCIKDRKPCMTIETVDGYDEPVVV